MKFKSSAAATLDIHKNGFKKGNTQVWVREELIHILVGSIWIGTTTLQSWQSVPNRNARMCLPIFTAALCDSPTVLVSWMATLSTVYSCEKTRRNKVNEHTNAHRHDLRERSQPREDRSSHGFVVMVSWNSLRFLDQLLMTWHGISLFPFS